MPLWPADYPLPPPKWGASRPALHLSEEQYEELVSKAEAILSCLLITENYDSVSNFLTLYDCYMASHDDTLHEFFQKYNPPIRPRKSNCVGLGMEVIKKMKSLEKDYPGITKSLMLVSCFFDHTTSQGSQGFLFARKKEHVMVAIHVTIGERNGVFLLDLGYHISRVVIVMSDRCHPHTGWFIQSDEPHCRKEHNYQFNLHNTNFIEWHERETRGSNIKERVSLIYVAKAYLSAVSVTEKRNLVWDLKRNLFARDQNGSLVAGIYFPLKPKTEEFTIFFDSISGKQRKKLKFETFLELQKIPDEVVGEVEQCNEQLHLREGELLSILKRLAIIVADEEYIKEVLAVNNKIVLLSAGN